MPYDEGLAERLREIFASRKNVTERKMFGGIAFMVSGNMCCGVVNDVLMARVGADQHDAALKIPHARKMDFTGKPMKGFVYVAPEGFESDSDLAYWIGLCTDFVATLPAK
ncbi:MAG: TfoX/Sxy family protein [Thiobacillaceae bacterium]|jgi:TfoX/Sxy family transcriptional regulator of competence genes